jgi:hypothetical protein
VCATAALLLRDDIALRWLRCAASPLRRVAASPSSCVTVCCVDVVVLRVWHACSQTLSTHDGRDADAVPVADALIDVAVSLEHVSWAGDVAEAVLRLHASMACLRRAHGATSDDTCVALVLGCLALMARWQGDDGASMAL